MKNQHVVALLVLATGGVWAAIQADAYLAVGETAPPIQGKGTDGKEYDSATITKEKPLFVVFWKERCPHNKKASELFNAIHKAYAGKVPFVGIVNANAEGAKSWVEQFDLNYALLPDASKEVIGAYKVKYSICTFEIGTNGKVVRVFEGYGADAMKQLNEAMAKAAGASVADIDLSGAPGRRTWG